MLRKKFYGMLIFTMLSITNAIEISASQSKKVCNSSAKFSYDAWGYANWYGKEHHKSSTASGTQFNMGAMTAAHKTLPFSTHVQVTNPANGKHVVVKVTDRGPHTKNTIIDVSHAAAIKLGIVDQGRAKVHIKSLGKNNCK